MYKIIGADGREYGPVSAEVLRAWIVEGRANAHTKILPEGTADWKKLSELPEFSLNLEADLGVAGPAGTPPVLAPGSTPEAIAREILATPCRFDVTACLRRGWELVKARFWLMVGVTLLMTLVSVGLSAAPFVGPFAGICFAYVIWGGVDWMILKLVRGQAAEVGDAFAGFTLAFVPLLLFGIVGHLLTMLGFVLLILPGVYLLVAWHLFTPLLILDKRLDFWTAMEVSRKVVTRYWWPVFGLFLLCLVVILLGLAACGIGVLVASPVVITAIVYAYEDLFRTRAKSIGPQDKPPSGSGLTTPIER